MTKKNLILIIIGGILYFLLGVLLQDILKIKEFWIYGFCFYILGFFIRSLL